MVVIAKGFKFPFQPSSQAVPAPSTVPDLLIESVKQILLTVKGERVMRPEFGSNLTRYIFENLNPAGTDETKQAIQEEVRTAITRWDSRVVITSIDVTQQDDSAVFVDVGLQFLGYTVQTGSIQIN